MREKKTKNKKPLIKNITKTRHQTLKTQSTPITRNTLEILHSENGSTFCKAKCHTSMQSIYYTKW